MDRDPKKTLSKGTMTCQAVQAKSIGEAGKEFLSQLTQHFENDQPDVPGSELETGDAAEPFLTDGFPVRARVWNL